MSGADAQSKFLYTQQSGRRSVVGCLAGSAVSAVMLTSRQAAAQAASTRDEKTLRTIQDQAGAAENALILIVTPSLGEPRPSDPFLGIQERIVVTLSETLTPLERQQINYVCGAHIDLAIEMQNRGVLVPPETDVRREIQTPLPLSAVRR